ncbi:unnamed protein product [Haemonchus placei]|uniref:Secreted protein n=1 Tax=Haemonchus placei TaxID=6290 RepID=A0A0N4WFW0_HAEPC|nr:unnamed protein product [Haemonchus placei]
MQSCLSFLRGFSLSSSALALLSLAAFRGFPKLALIADAERSREAASVAPLPLLDPVFFAEAERFLGALFGAPRHPPILA